MFLEIRFGVLSARYLPGQVISKADVAKVYACRPAIVAEVLNALTHEGYLTRKGRSDFTVRNWGREEIEDLFEMRANFEGLAAYRAAERATAAEISLLDALAAPSHKTFWVLRSTSLALAATTAALSTSARWPCRASPAVNPRPSNNSADQPPAVRFRTLATPATCTRRENCTASAAAAALCAIISA